MPVLLEILSLCLLAAVVGCGQKRTDTAKAPADGVSETETEADRCRRKLSAAIRKLQPDSMALQGRRDTVISGLNSWLTTCAAGAGRSMKLSEANAALLSPAAQRFATASRFTENDAVYIRDSLLVQGLAESVWRRADEDSAAGAASDRERVIQLFSAIVQNISLMDPAEKRVPVGVYEVMLTGRGRHEDRTWAFAEALRQRQIDAFLVRTAAAPAENSAGSGILDRAESLVAVAVGTDVLLFDSLAGTPVPAAGDSSILITSPATLNELGSHDRWKNITVELIAHPASFSPRMLQLQEQLVADDAATLYEELAGGASEIRPLLERIVDAGGGRWGKDDISIWSYPEQTTAAAAALTEEEQQDYALLLKPFDAPFERDPLKSREIFDSPGVTDEQLSEAERDMQRRQILEERLRKIEESSEELFGKASKRLLLVRIEQVMGDSDVSMIQQLQQIRIASMQNDVEVNVPLPDKKESIVRYELPAAIRQVHRNATGDSLYWTSQCQMARNEYGAAVTTLRNYRRQYPDEKWFLPSILHESVALIRMNNPNAARSALVEADKDGNPDRVQVQWLLARLPAEPAPAEPAPAEPAPAEPAPAEPAPAEPAPAEPAPAEPAPAEPAPAEPAPAEPAPAEPAPAEPAPAEPAPAEPAPAEPEPIK